MRPYVVLSHSRFRGQGCQLLPIMVGPGGHGAFPFHYIHTWSVSWKNEFLFCMRRYGTVPGQRNWLAKANKWPNTKMRRDLSSDRTVSRNAKTKIRRAICRVNHCIVERHESAMAFVFFLYLVSEYFCLGTSILTASGDLWAKWSLSYFIDARVVCSPPMTLIGFIQALRFLHSISVLGRTVRDILSYNGFVNFWP